MNKTPSYPLHLSSQGDVLLILKNGVFDMVACHMGTAAVAAILGYLLIIQKGVF